MKKSKKRANCKEMKDVILSKFTVGRDRGIKKRKKTLLMEYKQLTKSNKFVDRRIGEKDRAMTNDDRIMARFVAHQVKAHNKKQIFNLDNDEVFTHQGRMLQDIEKYDNPQSESDDADEDDGKLKADFVEKAHFGGGLFTKASNDDNHRSTIDQLIAESKKRKAERQQTKEETQTLTDKLDKDLKELFPVFAKSAKDEDETMNIVKFAKESYDVLVRELRFEPVGKPSNKSKNEDQMKNEEQQRLQKMECERLKRMKHGVAFEDEEMEEESAVNKLPSADSLDDGFDLDVFDEEASNEECSDGNDEDADSEEDNNDSDCGDVRIAKKFAQLSNNNNNNNSKSSKVPSSLEQLQKITNCFDVSKKILVIENLLRDQKVHCGTSNHEHLVKFFSLLLEYIDSLFIPPIAENSWRFVEKLSPILFELVQLGGDEAAEIVYKKLAEKQAIFSSREKPDITVDVIILLKIVPLLFPASDYYHPITTPASVFLSQILSKNACNTLQHIAKGLFAATTILEYVSLSHRYCPEVINFLRNVLYTAVADFEDIYPPLRMTNKILVLSGKSNEDDSQIEDALLPCSFISENVPETDVTKLMLIRITLKLLATFCELYKNLSAGYAIWLPMEKLLDKLPIDSYPSCIQNAVKDFLSQIVSITQKPVTYLVAERKRPKALRLYEPNIRPIIEGRSLRTVSQAKLEKEKLLRLYKREKKGAIKEIRKDRNFLASVKLSEQAKRDAERKNKVKQIFGWGQSQQSELKRMERKNRFRR